MADDGGVESDVGTLKYPIFEYGEDLYVSHRPNNVVEFSSDLPNQFIRAEIAIDPSEIR